MNRSGFAGGSTAEATRDQREAVRVQLAKAEAEAKAANDRAWATGEQQSAAEQRAVAERARADRVEAQAVHEREDLLDAEARKHEHDASWRR